VTVLGTDTLRPDDVARLARRAGCPIVLAAEATERMERSVALRDELVADGRPIYGVTTGFGDSNVGHISAAKAAALQHSLVQYHLVGSGPPAPADVVRATMAVRANCLARGYSGVRTEVVQLLIDCLAHDILPLIPERGSVGASGDLVRRRCARPVCTRSSSRRRRRSP
jgi:histidine ammonia-lyase